MRFCQPGPGQFDPEVRQGHADGHLIQADLEGAVHTHTIVRGKQQQGAHGQGMAADREYHRGGKGQEALGHFRTGTQQAYHTVTALPHHRQVKAGGEFSRPAADDDHLAGLLRRIQRRCKLRQHLETQGVGLAVVQGDQGVVGFCLVLDQCGHVCSSSQVTGRQLWRFIPVSGRQ